jgi:hypothetical protein
MTSRITRSLAIRIASVVVITGAAAGLVAASNPDVTRPRLETSLTESFTNLYLQQSDILGTPTTAARINAKPVCDRGGPTVEDVGPGADWICMMDFTDLTGAPQQGKFELVAKANYCFTASSPSKLTGLLTITDMHGKDALNPVFEFDVCYDPAS